MTEHNNPPAFPALAHWDRNSQMSTALQFPGMTLLDHFAGLAMQGWLASFPEHVEASGAEKSRYQTARLAYLIADAMLKERAKWIKSQ